MYSSLLDLKIGQSDIIKFTPFFDIDIKINASVKIISMFETSYFKASVKPLSLNMNIDNNKLIKMRQKIQKLIGSEYEEVWHKDYPDKDAGNLIDNEKYISNFLDEIQHNLKWPFDKINYNKVLLKTNDNFNLDEFHLDYYTGSNEIVRHLGEMKRILINLNSENRYLAVFNIPSSSFKLNFTDPYKKIEHIKFYQSIKQQVLELLLIEIPPLTNNIVYGLEFDSFNTLHCGYGYKNDFGAILSSYKKVLTNN